MSIPLDILMLTRFYGEVKSSDRLFHKEGRKEFVSLTTCCNGAFMRINPITNGYV